MTNERRFERRPPARGGGGGSGGGGGQGDFRPGRGGPPRFGAPRRSFDERPRFADRPEGGRRPGPPDHARHGGGDDGGMTVRVDPRRLRLLKELAAAAGVRPGELVQQWVEERLDAERAGAPATGEILDTLNATLASLSSRLDALAGRVGALERAPAAAGPAATAGPGPAAEPPADAEPAQAAAATAPQAPTTPRRRGRPRRETASTPASAPAAPDAAGDARVALHEEIIEVIRERGPMRAGELASAIGERGHYRAPRSSKPLDATTINSRVSNPVYRDRFVRREGKIGLADE